MDQPWLIITLIGFAIILYARLFIKEASPYQKVMQELEETFEHFALELEEENNQLIDHIAKMKEQYDQQNATLMNRIEYLEKKINESSVPIEKRPIENDPSNPEPQTQIVSAEPPPPEEAEPKWNLNSPDVSPPPVNSTRDTIKKKIKERYEPLFQLYDQGKSMEYIAKKLDMNKGEVQLIIQLAKQEELSSG